jgi:hypothetical protein
LLRFIESFWKIMVLGGEAINDLRFSIRRLVHVSPASLLRFVNRAPKS